MNYKKTLGDEPGHDEQSKKDIKTIITAWTATIIVSMLAYSLSQSLCDELMHSLATMTSIISATIVVYAGYTASSVLVKYNKAIGVISSVSISLIFSYYLISITSLYVLPSNISIMLNVSISCACMCILMIIKTINEKCVNAKRNQQANR